MRPGSQGGSARCVDRHVLAGIVESARARGGRAPSDGWLAQLADGQSHVGIAAHLSGDTMVAVWAGQTRSGRRLEALIELPRSAWLALDEVTVPVALERWALAVAAEAGALPD
jgi:hypothetical protein